MQKIAIASYEDFTGNVSKDSKHIHSEEKFAVP